MPLQKQELPINFSQGLDTKTDPFQLSPGKFLSLQNSIFDVAGRLTKRNGFSALTSLPESGKFLTTFNGNLTAIGDSLQAYSSGSASWVNKGYIKPIEFSTIPLIRSNFNQTQVDSAVSATNNLVCTVYTDSTGSSVTYKYVVTDLITGQNIVSPTVIPVGSGTIEGSARVFVLGRYFLIVFTNHIGGAFHLQYIAISIADPTIVTTNSDLVPSYIPSSTLSYDGVVVNNSLVLAYNTTSGGQSIKVIYLDSSLQVSSPITFAGEIATMMSVSADTSTPSPTIYAAYYDLPSTEGKVLAVQLSAGGSLNTVLAPTTIIAGDTVNNITSTAGNGVVKVFYEVNHTYLYDTSISTNYIDLISCTQASVVSSVSTIKRSLGLASKAFTIDGISYALGIYNSTFQPTYFLFDEAGNIVSKFAYSNGGVYYTVGLPNVSVSGSTAYIPYQIKDLIEAVNKNQNPTSAAGVYSQVGLNLATFLIDTSTVSTSEIAQDLNISGGFLWQYDGYEAVEQGFFLWPDYVGAATSSTGGSITAQQYYYQVTYEWSDNQGNIFRSAPSIPQGLITTGSTSSITLNIPTLRLTYKISNPVKIVIYRWSVAQQNYYQVTSITTPLVNDPTIDFVTYTDTLADSSIIGNNLIYTTGGVLENIGPPPTNVVTLFDNRLFLLDAEDTNLLWFSKQVIEDVPVEMSDLLTIYVAPTTAAQGSTGPTKAAAPLDGNLILFKRDAIYYINGRGPDSTGANNQYSDATFITSTVGSSNQHSIAFMPNGLMFESDKGIWLLDRNLATSYIGAPVEKYTNTGKVVSALAIPGTNQVRFVLDSGITLMYDYFYSQWGVFAGIPNISSTLYKNLHTFINDRGDVMQESPGIYLDNTTPVLLSFTTSWINLSGIQGYERLYYAHLLGVYITPFKLNVQIAYDYNTSPEQSIIVAPDNYTLPWGGEQLWGSGGGWGGPGNVFESRIFNKKQKCESFQVTINEVYDPSFGIASGAGLTLSGLNLTVGMKKGTRVSPASKSFG